MCRTKCNIIWRVLNIYDRAIIMMINKYNVVINFMKPKVAEQYFPWIKYIYIYNLFIIIYIYIYIYIVEQNLKEKR